MKRTALLLLSILPFYTLASSVQRKDPLASELMIPLFNTGKFISAEDFTKLSPKNYKLITGKKMNLTERLSLSFGKKALKKAINRDGTVNMEKMKAGGFWKHKWHWGGFALGFFLSFIGVIVTLFYKDEYKWDRFWTALRAAIFVFLIVGVIISISDLSIGL